MRVTNLHVIWLSFFLTKYLKRVWNRLKWNQNDVTGGLDQLEEYLYRSVNFGSFSATLQFEAKVTIRTGFYSGIAIARNQ